MAEGVTVANAFVQVMPSMEGATSNLTDALVPSLSSAGDKAGTQFGSMFSGKLGALAKGAGAMLAGYLAVDALADSYTEVESGLNKVIVATGATGEAAEQLKDVYLDVAGSVVGSFDDIGSAVGELNTRFGLQGEELEAASEQAMKYAKITGQDATKAVQDVSRMMNNAGISASEYSHVLDLLTVAAQQSGIDAGKLATSVTENAASFRQLGFSTEESIAMLAQFEKSGVNSSQVLAGMKKGVAEWAQQGMDAGEGFRTFVQGIQEGSITSADAIELFGAKAGMAMYDAAMQGQLSWDDMFVAITEGSDGALDQVYNDTLTAQEKFDVLGKKVQTGFYEIMEPIIDAIEPYIDDIIAAIADFVEFVVNDAVPKIKIVIGVIGDVIKWVQEFADSLKPVADDANRFCSNVGQFFSNLSSNIHAIFDAIAQFMRNPVENAYNFISTIPGSIASAFSGLVSHIWSYVSGITSTLTAPFESAYNFIIGIPDRIVSWFSGLGTRISNAFGSINFPSPHVEYWDISVADWRVPIPYVSWYGKGGFADEATISGSGNGYGERGLEMYWPSYAPYFDKYAKGIAEHMPASGVDIHDCTFNVRKDSDIRAVAIELNTLINRQTAGGIA